MKRTKLLLPLAILTAFSAGCTPGSNGDSTSGGKNAPSVIQVEKVAQKNLRRVIEQPATIEAFEETPLVAHIAGYVEKDAADIGKIVKGPKVDAKGTLINPGEVLASLYVPQMLRELEQKQALVLQAKAEVEQVKAALDAADAFILTAKAQVREAQSARARAVAGYEYWKAHLARIEDAVKDRVIEKQVRDETLNKFKAAEAARDEVEAKVQSAQAALKESEAKRAKAKADVDASIARVQVAQADEARFAALVDYRFIRAPFDGVVTQRKIHTGHYLQPGSGQNVLFVVARIDTLRIVAEIPEAEAGYISRDLTATIHAPTLKDQTFEGKIARTGWSLDSKSRTLRVEIDYPNQAGKLLPGMYVNLTFSVELGKRWTIPAAAIFSHGDQPCCWRSEGGKARRTPLKLGVRDGHDVEVTKMQTRPGTWVAVTGQEEVVVAGRGAVSEGESLPAAK